MSDESIHFQPGKKAGRDRNIRTVLGWGDSGGHDSRHTHTHIHTLYTYTQDSAFSSSISFISSRSFFKRINGLGRSGPRPFPTAQGEHKRTDELEVEELAAQFVAKIEQLIGTTASREFTCLGVVYSVTEAREFTDMSAADLRSQIALVEQDLTAYRSAKTAGQA